MKYSFVILHYKNTQETIKCINSILSYEEEVSIVVIDNGSCDGSGQYLKKLYSETLVNFIILNKKRGFSEANNIGCRYIIKVNNPDFLIVCNNDVQFTDKYMLNKIEDIYIQEGFGVLGPDIYNKKLKEHQSPFRLEYATANLINKEIQYYKRKKLFLPLEHLGIRIINKIPLINKASRILNFYRIKNQHRKFKCFQKQKNVVLYGACLIFSKEYFKKYSSVFYPETFFYCEEDILFLRCLKDNILICYDPGIQVTHTNKASTYYGNRFKQELWRLDRLIESRKIYLNILDSID